jgi:hypothetical protein
MMMTGEQHDVHWQNRHADCRFWMIVDDSTTRGGGDIDTEHSHR